MAPRAARTLAILGHDGEQEPLRVTGLPSAVRHTPQQAALPRFLVLPNAPRDRPAAFPATQRQQRRRPQAMT
jgi:hypothetical protein